MKKKDINLEPMHEFLTSCIYVDQLITSLDNLYYNFTHMAMRLSHLENEPVFAETLDERRCIESLKEVFEEIQTKNKTGNEN